MGIQNGDAISATYSSAATSNSPVGSYDIVPVAVDSDPANLSNYTLTLVNGSLTIGQATLIVTPNDQTKVYGEFLGTLDGSIVGIQNGDAISALYTSPGSSVAATVADGPYLISATLLDPDGKLANYAVSLNTGLMTVTPAALSVRVNDSAKTYGDALPSLWRHLRWLCRRRCRRFQQALAFFIRRRFKNLKQLPVAEIFLNDDSGGAVNVVNCGNRQSAFKEQTRDVQIRMDGRIERRGINRRHGGAALPGDAKILPRRSVRSQRNNLSFARALLPRQITGQAVTSAAREGA